MARTNNDQTHLRRLRDTYARMGCIPSYSQMAKSLGFKAKNSAYKLTQRLIASGHLIRSTGGRLAPGCSFFTLEISDDDVRAGFGAQGSATGLLQAQALDQLLVSRPSKTMLLKVRGESMVDAGIYGGDVAVVETSSQAVHGDIVIAEIDGSPTIKELKMVRGKYCLIAHGVGEKTVAPKESLNIIGVVRGIVRSYKTSEANSVKFANRGVFI